MARGLANEHRIAENLDLLVRNGPLRRLQSRLDEVVQRLLDGHVGEIAQRHVGELQVAAFHGVLVHVDGVGVALLVVGGDGFDNGLGDHGGSFTFCSNRRFRWKRQGELRASSRAGW